VKMRKNNINNNVTIMKEKLFSIVRYEENEVTKSFNKFERINLKRKCNF